MDFDVKQQSKLKIKTVGNEKVGEKRILRNKKKLDLPFTFRDNEKLDYSKVLGLDEVKKKPKIKSDNEFKELNLLPRIHIIEK